MDALKQAYYYTLDDYYNSFPEKRVELIYGKIYDMASPRTVHQRLLMRLSALINSYIQKKGGPCEIFPGPFDVILFPDRDDVCVVPDISVICDKNKLNKKGCHGAPDWIIEKAYSPYILR